MPSHYHSAEHDNDVKMSTTAFEIISLTIVYSTVYLGADQRKLQSSSSLAFVWGNPREPENSPYKGTVTRKTFPFDDVIMRKLKAKLVSGKAVQNGNLNVSLGYEIYITTCPITIRHDHDSSC